MPRWPLIWPGFSRAATLPQVRRQLESQFPREPRLLELLQSRVGLQLRPRPRPLPFIRHPLHPTRLSLLMLTSVD